MNNEISELSSFSPTFFGTGTMAIVYQLPRCLSKQFLDEYWKIIIHNKITKLSSFSPTSFTDEFRPGSTQLGFPLPLLLLSQTSPTRMTEKIVYSFQSRAESRDSHQTQEQYRPDKLQKWYHKLIAFMPGCLFSPTSGFEAPFTHPVSIISFRRFACLVIFLWPK